MLRVSLLLSLGVLARAEVVTLDEAVRRALERYGAVRVSTEKSAEAAQAIALARTAYLPRADFLGQLNRATRNNLFGMVFPQATLPGISGPPLAENSMTNVWGTMVGFTVSWEPFDFGLRKAEVNAAEAQKRRAELGVERTRFEVAAATADAYLTLLAAEEMVKSTEAARKRAAALEEVVAAQVRAELRPGLDLTRAKAETALAESQKIQAEQAVAIAQANLSQYLGVTAVETNSSRWLVAPPAELFSASDAKAHPVLREQSAAIEAAQAKQKILDKTYYPKFAVQGSTYARGSGANPDFTTGGAFAGLGPNIVNWGTAMTVTFPAWSLPGLRVQKEIEAARTRAEQERWKQLSQDLEARLERARAQLTGARRLAAQMPILKDSARATQTQATARYQAGLATIVEIADAERLVTQTEIDDALSRLAVWRALLGVATAQGNLEPFLLLTGGKP